MKKRRMLALALALALIMSLVPVSGLAAEPVGFMDPGAVMQEDTEESVNTEAVNGEEALSPDTVGDGEEGSWQDPAGSAEDNGADQALEEMPAAEDDGADQALEETPAAEDDGADQALEETPAVEDDGADQVLEETPAVEDDGADQDLEEEAAVEEENSEPVDEEDAEAVEVSAPDQNEETADAQEAVSEDTQEAAAADIQETAASDTQEAGPVDETAVPAEDGSAAESAVDETMLPAEEESLADTSVNEVEDGYSYVLMNIPYAEFYAAELEAGSPAVDAVASATKNKPRTGTLAGGSYHVDPEGTDISGVIYPVKASNDDIAALIAYDENLMITDESIIAITVTNRGQETTTWYEGRDALFEAPDHSFYITDDDPAYYKEMSMEADGTMTFGPVQGDAVSVEGVTGAVTIGARHANIEIKLSGTDGVAQGDAVSGAVVTAVDDEGNATQYGLRHVVNIWRGTEIGWNYDELDIYGKTITNIRYYKQDAVIDYPVDIPVRAQYVLMNIPYADFYAAELKAGSAAVDAVASATKSKPLNARLAGGSYHVNADGSDISGVIYPVKVNSPEDLAKLEEKGAAVITDDSSVEVSVPGRNGADPTITVYNGKDALFQAPDYSYYDLGSGIQSFFKELTVAEDGTLSFGAVKGSTTRAEAEVSVTANASHTYYEMKVTSDYVQTGDTVSAVVLTAEDGTTYGLRHMANLWRGTEIGFEADETFSALIGKKITGLKFITQNGIYNFTVDALIPEKLPEYVLMNIPYADFYPTRTSMPRSWPRAARLSTRSLPRRKTNPAREPWRAVPTMWIRKAPTSVVSFTL